jgi:DNA-binding CsgD family transcriptional regulator
MTETARLMRDLSHATSAPARRRRYPAGLTEREVEVLRLAAKGLTTAEVAERLYLSPRTVESHLQRIYAKLAVPSRGAAIRFAVKHDLV